MIVLTLVDGDGDIENEDVFVNPAHIIFIMQNDSGNTEVNCVDQIVIEVKETAIQVFNLINNKVN